ncbi:MAG: DMT family transporter, partial [Thermomicrobiaceae bacterium]|nr:DMT family transporter [Thermomicrobiaceae bacterium]
MARSTGTTLSSPAATREQPGGVSVKGLLLAIVAVASVSTSAVFIRLAGAVSPYEIALWRLVVASCVLAPPMLASGAWPAVRRVGLRRFALYGAILSGHFITYNLALRYSPIAHVLPLLYTSTIMVAVLSAVVLKERLRPRQIVGIGVVLVGIAVLAGFEPTMSRRILIGDLIAVGSAVTFALYSLVGRRERERVPLLGYAVGVYALAAVWTAPVAAVGHRGGYDLRVVL